VTDLLGMPEEKFAVLIGKRGEDRETAVAPLTREQHRHFQRFIAKHMDELVEHMAEVGVDARTIVTPDLYRFATPDDIRLYGSLEQRRSLIARLMADVRADEPASQLADPSAVANTTEDAVHIQFVDPSVPPIEVAERVAEKLNGGNG
jgi:hypothetical protein